MDRVVLGVQAGFRGRRHDVEMGPDGWWLFAVPAPQDERLDLSAILDPLVSDQALGTAD